MATPVSPFGGVMTPTRRSRFPIRRTAVTASVPLLAVLALALASASDLAGEPPAGGLGGGPAGGPAAPAPAPATGDPARVAPGALEFRFTDDRLVQLKLREDRIAIVTRYGRLVLP